MTDEPGSYLDEEPQSERGAPGSRDTGSDEPAGGPVDRPVGTSDAEAHTGVDPQRPLDPDAPHLQEWRPGRMSTDSFEPRDTEPAVPPYEGRRTSADVDTSGASAHREGAAVGGATGPVVSGERSAPEPEDTPRGAVASPADEQPGSVAASTEASDPGVGPSHQTGTKRAEDQS